MVAAASDPVVSFNEDAMKRLLLMLAFFGQATLCVADDAAEMLINLQANFDACNREDPDALLETCSKDMPNREQFRQEAARLFREKDLHYSLMDFKLLGIRGDYAVAVVVQKTHTNDRESPSASLANYRNSTTLLPVGGCVRYKVAFKRDGRQWKGYVTLTNPVQCDP
jgi:hypothetical protein